MVSQTFLALGDLGSVGRIGQAFSRMPLDLGSSSISLLVRSGVWVWEGDLREVQCRLHDILSRCTRSPRLQLLLLALVTTLGWCLSGSSTVKFPHSNSSTLLVKASPRP